jgi:hypothetical protein
MLEIKVKSECEDKLILYHSQIVKEIRYLPAPEEYGRSWFHLIFSYHGMKHTHSVNHLLDLVNGVFHDYQDIITNMLNFRSLRENPPETIPFLPSRT